MPELNIGDGPLPAYLSIPSGDGPWPGVVVIHDISGHTEDTVGQTDWLAANGYLALAPNLYSRGSKALCVASVIRDAAFRSGRTVTDLEHSLAHLSSRADCTGRLGVIGFCLGGSFALMLATNDAVSASSVNYANVPLDAKRFLKGACPIVASFGGKDYPLRYAPAVLADATRVNNIDADIKVYPQAGHAFLNDFGPPQPPGIRRQWAHLSGTRMDTESAVDARRRIIAFFDQHLNG